MCTKENITGYIALLDTAGIEYTRDVPLAPRTTLRIGGNADVGVFPDSEKQIAEAIRDAKKCGARYMMLGNGSNVLFDDAGFRGAVIFTKKLRGVSVDATTLCAGAGASLLAVTTAARDAGLSGLEFAYGIPSSCGGAVCMNAGAYGGDMASVVAEVAVYDSEKDRICRLDASEMRFAYRKSIVGNGERYTVLSVTFELECGDKNTITEKMTELMKRRAEKQPLNFPSAGSAFKRPAPDKYVGKMIEDSGLKGYSVGGAQVSEKHAGFIVNRGGATSDDMIKLIGHIKNTISENYGVDLECEIRLIPEKA